MPRREPSKSRRLDGDHILYSYLQRELLQSDIWLFQMLAARLIVGLGVWLGVEIYANYPLLRPYAVRDPESRGNARKGLPDQWGSPNADGLFRDDNSLIKHMPYSLYIHGPKNHLYEGTRIRKGYVASHVWRQLKGDQGLASRHRLTYSFVPNLVWLPREVSKLTDREGSFVQTYIQALSLQLYQPIAVHEGLQPLVESAWSLLPEPIGIPPEGLPPADELNSFVPTERIFKVWIRDLDTVIDALRRAQEGRRISNKVVSSRYGSGLSKIAKSRLDTLADHLEMYRTGVGSVRAEALET
jgi:hypothetical protein